MLLDNSVDKTKLGVGSDEAGQFQSLGAEIVFGFADGQEYLLH